MTSLMRFRSIVLGFQIAVDSQLTQSVVMNVSIQAPRKISGTRILGFLSLHNCQKQNPFLQGPNTEPVRV